LAGAEAVECILSFAGDDPAIIPAEVTAPDLPAVPPTRRMPVRRPDGDLLARRIRAFAARVPNLSEGQGRDDKAFHFACFLVRDLNLADADALPWLEEWDANNRPPKGRERLSELLKNAREYGQRPYGCGLDQPSRVIRFRVPTTPVTSRDDRRPDGAVLRLVVEGKTVNEWAF
jgi:hypothetical protein